MHLEKITFTGVDVKTPLDHLQKLTTQFPMMELGILLSSNKMGKDNRYPTLEQIKKIVKVISNKKQLAIHLCGKWCVDLIETGSFEHLDILKYFSRIQLNFSYNKLSKIEYCKLKNNLSGLETIIQLHGRNINLLFKLYELNAKVSGLHDSSGGKGIATKWNFGWPYKGIKYGYAGGLGPGNIRKKLSILKKNLGRDEVTWVDMESNVRKDNWFSLALVEQCLKESKTFL